MWARCASKVACTTAGALEISSTRASLTRIVKTLSRTAAKKRSLGARISSSWTPPKTEVPT